MVGGLAAMVPGVGWLMETHARLDLKLLNRIQLQGGVVLSYQVTDPRCPKVAVRWPGSRGGYRSR